jgi:hypothetical protein
MPETVAEVYLQVLTNARTSPGASEMTAGEIAKLLGRSDKWVRDQRAVLEWIYYWQTEALKTSDGRRYTEFAFIEIAKLQASVGSGVPLVKDGKLQTDRKGKAKIKRQSPPTTLADYSEKIWQEWEVEPNLTPFSEAESPTEVQAEVLGEEVEQGAIATTSTVLIFPQIVPDAQVQNAEGIDQLAHDLGASLQGLQAFATHLGSNIGENLGFGQAIVAGIQRDANRAMQAFAQSSSSAQPQTAVTTQPKAVKVKKSSSPAA